MYSYARISDDREGRRYGVDRQLRDNKRLAERNGDEIVEEFVDDDRSAYSGKRRPDYERMLQGLRDGRAEGVYALAPTRLYRRLDGAQAFFKLINDRGLSVETVKAGRFNLTTADGRRDALRAAIDAQHESELISERVRDAKADNAARGEYRGGPRPFGFDADGVTARALLCPVAGCSGRRGFDEDRRCLECGAEAVNEPGSEFAEIARGIDGVIAGESVRSLAAGAKAAGHRTPARRRKQPDGTKGEPESHDWSEINYRRMLLRARNAGLVEHEGEIIGRGQWPAAVPEEKWRAARDILQNPARRTSPGNARVWLGAGIYNCWCGAKLKCTTTGTGGRAKAEARKARGDSTSDKTHAPAYKCRDNAGHVIRRAVNLDEYVEGLAMDRLSRPDAAELLLPPALTVDPRVNLAAEANALRAKLDSIAADYAEDLITRPQMIAMTATTRARLDQVETAMVDASRTSLLSTLPLGSPEIGEQWETYDLEKRRAIISAIMTVTVQRARRGRPPGFKAGTGQTYFDADTIEVCWIAPE